MIPRADIVEWRAYAPWKSDAQVEQDLIICRLLVATKLRALYQRKKGRDLFDLWYGLTKGKADPRKIIGAFGRYIEFQEAKISQKQLRENLLLKINDRNFTNDTQPLLRPDITYLAEEAYSFLDEKLLRFLP